MHDQWQICQSSCRTLKLKLFDWFLFLFRFHSHSSLWCFCSSFSRHQKSRPWGKNGRTPCPGESPWPWRSLKNFFQLKKIIIFFEEDVSLKMFQLCFWKIFLQISKTHRHWSFSEEQRSRRSLTPRRQSEARHGYRYFTRWKLRKGTALEIPRFELQALPLRPMSRQGSDMSRQCSEPHKIRIRFGFVSIFHIFSHVFDVFDF